MKHLIAVIIGVLVIASAHAQQITYQVKEANVDKYKGYVMPELGMHLGGGSLLGFDLGVQSQYRLPVLPLTLRGTARWEFAGLGKTEFGRTRLLDVGAMLPLTGRAKPGRVIITTDYSYSSTYISEEYFAVDGEVRRSLMARGGLYHLWTSGGLATTGFSAGLGFNVTEHALVHVSDGNTYETFHNWQLFADAMVAPMAKGTDLIENELTVGGKVGLLSTGANWDWYGEVSIYPKNTVFLLFGFLLDLGVMFE